MKSTNPSEQTADRSQIDSSQPIDNLIDLLCDLKSVSSEERAVVPESSETQKNTDNSSLSPTEREINSSSLESELEAIIGVDESLMGETAEVSSAFPPPLAESELELEDDARYLDVDVDAESRPTLLEAVAYEAFLRQTVSNETESLETVNSELADKPQELIELEATVDGGKVEVAELADALNNLIPLIVELLQQQNSNSQEAILETVTPALDRIIEQRSKEDRCKMARAIAAILPNAISEEIQLSPQAIAKAIAPEVALAIEEQIRLDKDAISNALGSEMGKAIKTQIELEKDAMVDALYPVIGNTISKYMVEVVQSINDRVENALSVEGIKRKMRAKIRGVSEAELIFQESFKYSVQAVFLIDKDSGLIIQEVQSDGSDERLESDMVGGMLTAIRSFANDCIASGSELDEIDYGDWQIPIEVAGYCYLAAIVKGEPSQHFRKKLRDTLSNIVMKYGKEIEAYQGDADSVPQQIQPILQDLTIAEQKTKKSSPATILWLLAILLGAIAIPWGIINYRGAVAAKIEKETALALDARPELAIYRLDPSVEKGKLTLTGRVPSQYLRSQTAAVGQKIAEEYDLQLDNQIVAVNIPSTPEAIAQEISRLTNVFNQQPQIAIETEYQHPNLDIRGFILREEDLEIVRATFQNISGINTIVANIERQLPSSEIRIYFPSGTSKLNLAADSSKIEAIKEFIDRYPQLHWQAIGYSDRQGSSNYNRQLGLNRANSVRDALIGLGVDAAKLQATYSPEPPPGIDPERSLLLSRCVRLQSFIPTNSSN